MQNANKNKLLIWKKIYKYLSMEIGEFSNNSVKHLNRLSSNIDQWKIKGLCNNRKAWKRYINGRKSIWTSRT